MCGSCEEFEGIGISTWSYFMISMLLLLLRPAFTTNLFYAAKRYVGIGEWKWTIFVRQRNQAEISSIRSTMHGAQMWKNWTMVSTHRLATPSPVTNNTNANVSNDNESAVGTGLANTDMCRICDNPPSIRSDVNQFKHFVTHAWIDGVEQTATFIIVEALLGTLMSHLSPWVDQNIDEPDSDGEGGNCVNIL